MIFSPSSSLVNLGTFTKVFVESIVEVWLYVVIVNWSHERHDRIPFCIVRHADLTLFIQYTPFLHLNLCLSAFLLVCIVVSQLVQHTHVSNMVVHSCVVAFEDGLKFCVLPWILLLDLPCVTIV